MKGKFYSTLYSIFPIVSFVLIFGLCVVAQEIDPGANPALQRGSGTARIRIEVFNDYQCGSCVPFNSILKKVEKDHKGKVLVIFRNFPLGIPAYNNSYAAARAVEAAGKQSKFSEMMDMVYKGQSKWSILDAPETVFYMYAKTIGLNLPKFNRDYNGYLVAARIDKDLARARSLKLDSTPSVFLNDKLLTFLEAQDLDRLISESSK